MGSSPKVQVKSTPNMLKYVALALLALAVVKAEIIHETNVNQHTINAREGIDSYDAPQAPVLSQHWQESAPVTFSDAGSQTYYPANGFSNVGLGLGANVDSGLSNFGGIARTALW